MTSNHKAKFENRYNKVVINNMYNYSKSNLEVLKDFFKLLLSEGISYNRQYKYLVLIPQLFNTINKDFIKVTKDDLVVLAGKIRSNENYRETTKIDYLGSIKKLYISLTILDKYKHLEPLYTWLYDKRNRFYSTNIDFKKDKIKKYWFTDGDVLRIIEKARTIRDKTIFSLLATQGMRPQELLTIKQKDINDNGGDEIQIEISGKTGTRSLFIQEGYVINYLREYLNTLSNNSEGILFKISDKRLNGILKEICREINLIKPVNLYKFRHFSVTRDRIKGMSAGALEQKYGWVKGSKRVAVYDKSSSKDYRKEAREIAGKDTSLIKETDFERVMGSSSVEKEIRELKELVMKQEERLRYVYEKVAI